MTNLFSSVTGYIVVIVVGPMLFYLLSSSENGQSFLTNYFSPKYQDWKETQYEHKQYNTIYRGNQKTTNNKIQYTWGWGIQKLKTILYNAQGE